MGRKMKKSLLFCVWLHGYLTDKKYLDHNQIIEICKSIDNLLKDEVGGNKENEKI